MIKRFLIAFVLLVLVAGGLVGFNIYRDKAIGEFFANMPVRTLTVSATEVAEVTWNPAIEAIGTVASSNGVDLTVETAGVVESIGFTANQEVEQGMVLVQLQSDVQRADLAAAESQIKLDEQAFERARQLKKQGFNSNVTVDTASAAASASRSQVAKLQAVLEQKQLKAPFPGVIGLSRIDIGQYVTPGTTIATLQDLDTMHANFTVPEQQFGLLQIGQSVRLGLNGNDFDYEGRIIGIDPKIDPATRLVSVRAAISNPQHSLRPGQFVQIRVDLPSEEGILAIPQTALVSSLFGDYVYAIREDTTTGDTPQLIVKQVFVRAGRRSGGKVEVAEGLTAGEQIVTSGQNRLSGGAVVTIDNSVDPAVLAQSGPELK